jgi:hypothetical protein
MEKTLTWFLDQKEQIAGIEYAQSAIEFIVFIMQ